MLLGQKQGTKKSIKKYGVLNNPFADFQVLKELVRLKYNKGIFLWAVTELVSFKHLKEVLYKRL